nr:hypothetical protein [Tanacetum cinerariifolium]
MNGMLGKRKQLLMKRRQVLDELNGRTHFLLRSSGKSANTPIDAEKPLLNDSDGEDVDVHTYRVFNSPMLHVLRVELVINSPWILSKNWLVQKQTVFGKDMSNPFMAGQTATGKESSNPFMAGVNTPRSDEDRLKLMELMVFLMKKDVCYEIGLNAACLSKLLLSGKCDVTRLQALVDKKRIVITEEVVREILQLNDAEGVICLPNEEIFAGFARMGYEKPSTKLTFYKAFFSTQWKFFIHTILHSLSAKRTSWNEFSSTMASALICLSSGQRFNFSKVGNGFSGVETPLFESMLAVGDVAEEAEAQVPTQGDDVQEPAAEEVATNVVPPTPTSQSPSSPVIPSAPPHQSPCTPQPQDAEGSSFLFQQVLATCSALALRVEDKQAEIYNIDLDHSLKVLSMQEDDTEVQEAVEIVTIAKLMTEVVTAAATQVVAASTPIPAAKPKTLTITAAPAVSTRRRKGVVIRDPEEELPFDTPAETPKVKDKVKGILIEAPKPIKKKDRIEMDAEYHGIKKKPQTESEARKNMIFYLKNTEGYKMDFFKGKKYDEILPIFQARFDANMKFLFKSREEMEKEDEEIIKRINETPAQKAAKRRKLSEEAQEADALRKRLEIVQDEDDDVYIKATPIAQKVPVMDYQIVVIDNKPKYKIIRADDTH